MALCPWPALTATLAALPARPDAEKVTGLPARPVLVAMSVLLLVPAVGPRRQLLTEAVPNTVWSVTLGAFEAIDPPPAPTANVTVTGTRTRLSLASKTLTLVATGTVVPTIAD